jgi:hypothetical protein
MKMRLNGSSNCTAQQSDGQKIEFQVETNINKVNLSIFTLRFEPNISMARKI